MGSRRNAGIGCALGTLYNPCHARGGLTATLSRRANHLLGRRGVILSI